MFTYIYKNMNGVNTLITIRLNYPYREDIKSYKVPLPDTYNAGDVCILLFHDTDDYFHYLDSICDMVDELEFNPMAPYQQKKNEKLNFCKRYLELLADADISHALIS